jgi:hypothetical protein
LCAKLEDGLIALEAACVPVGSAIRPRSVPLSIASFVTRE